MNEYQTGDLLYNVVSNIIADQTVYITMLSAYLVVAYTVGSKLTRYQVAFINFVFIVYTFIGILAQMAMLHTAIHYGDDMAEFRGESRIFSTTGEVARWAMIVIRLAMSVGALVFMWQVRHTKAD